MIEIRLSPSTHRIRDTSVVNFSKQICHKDFVKKECIFSRRRKLRPAFKVSLVFHFGKMSAPAFLVAKKNLKATFKCASKRFFSSSWNTLVFCFEVVCCQHCVRMKEWSHSVTWSEMSNDRNVSRVFFLLFWFEFDTSTQH